MEKEIQCILKFCALHFKSKLSRITADHVRGRMLVMEVDNNIEMFGPEISVVATKRSPVRRHQSKSHQSAPQWRASKTPTLIEWTRAFIRSSVSQFLTFLSEVCIYRVITNLMDLILGRLRKCSFGAGLLSVIYLNSFYLETFNL